MCKGSAVFSDDMLGARKTSQIDEFFAMRGHEALDVYYIIQSYFVYRDKALEVTVIE